MALPPAGKQLPQKIQIYWNTIDAKGAFMRPPNISCSASLFFIVEIKEVSWPDNYCHPPQLFQDCGIVVVVVIVLQQKKPNWQDKSY